MRCSATWLLVDVVVDQLFIGTGPGRRPPPLKDECRAV
jgi:hypothetical protein